MRLLIFMCVALLAAACETHEQPPAETSPVVTAPAPASPNADPIYAEPAQKLDRPFEAPRCPEYVDMEWRKHEGVRTAVIYESDQVDQLPADVESVMLSSIRWGCFGISSHLDDADVVRLAARPGVKRLHISIAVSETSLEAIRTMDSLQVLTLDGRTGGLSKEHVEKLKTAEGLQVIDHAAEYRK